MSIPNIIHKIWFGPLPEKYENSIKQWKAINPDYEVKLWCKPEILSEEEKAKLNVLQDEYGISIIDIDKINHEEYPNIDWVQEWLALPDEKIGKYRFAAASDILRTSILEVEGGHYLDTDIDSKGPLPVDMSVESDNYQVVSYDTPVELPAIEKEGYLVAYGIMGSTPNHDINKMANIYNNYMHRTIFSELSRVIKDEIDDNTQGIDLVSYMTGLSVSISIFMTKLIPTIIKSESESKEGIFELAKPFDDYFIYKSDRSYEYAPNISTSNSIYNYPIFDKIQEVWKSISDSSCLEESITMCTNTTHHTQRRKPRHRGI